MDSIRTATSFASDSQQAADEIRQQIADVPLALVMVFCAASHDMATLTRTLRRHFPAPTQVVGCTTAGEIGVEGYQDDSVVALGFPLSHFTASCTTISELAQFDSARCQQKVEALQQVASWQQRQREHQHRLALLLVDGLSMREEPLGRAIQLLLGDIPVIGGSAGDSLRFERTQVFCNEFSGSDAAVLVILSTNLPFHIIKTQHFERAGERMVVTEARPCERIVTEINGYPAALEYARIAGLQVSQLSPQAFAAFPVVVRIGGHEYVRSIQQVNADHSLRFYCAIDEGIVLTMARGLNALTNLREALDATEARIGKVQCVLAFDCILRNLEFRQKGLRAPISATLQRHNVIGFSSFGELHFGIHINQTLTGVAFGR